MSDNVIAKAEIRMGCVTARSKCSRCVLTASEFFHLADDVVESYAVLGAWVWPIPTCGC